ncbi:MAG TPA: radical SAM/SPASM domain-containing protein [Bacteroidia bacterium]|nr:radical SAM/SPASM domain-containing protein [Bacteroidia bacterium]
MVSLSNNIQLLKKLTFKKLINAFKVWGSYHVSKNTKKVSSLGFPISMAIEPTTSCNLRCPECPSGLRQFTRPIGMLEPVFFKKTIDEVYKELIYLTFYFQGEPYLNPNFLDMVKYASNKRIYTSTSTNAHYLTKEQARKTVESKLDRLIISIDGTTQDTYEQYRIGGQLQKVIDGAKNIIEAKKELKSNTPHVVFQFLVVKPNEHQLEDVKKLAHELGVDEVVFKTAQLYDFENGNPLIPENIKYSRYKKNNDGTYSIKNKLLNQCWRMWSSCVVTWDGIVVPCCFDKDAKHQLGDLKNQNFNELWKSFKYQNFRKSILKSRKEIDICKNCSEGTKVWT